MAKRDARHIQGIADLPIEDVVEGMTLGVRRVIARTHQAGRSTSLIKDGKLIRVYPDGREVVVKVLANT
jgi:hypothetical protein